MDICLGGSWLLVSLPFLLADFDELLGAIVPVIFVIIWVISQVMGSLGGAKKRRLAEESEERLEEASTASAPPQDLANEIQEFLRRAQQQTTQQQTTQQQATQQQATQQQATQQQKASEWQAAEVIPAEIVEAKPVEVVVVDPPPPTRKRGRAVARERQPSPATLADDSPLPMEERRHTTFDHQSSELWKTFPPIDQEQQPEIALEDVPEIPTTAAEIRSLLADAQSARKAFVLSEVFPRPEDRW
jgi:DNA primase